MKELVEDLKIANDNLYCANQMLEKEIEKLKSQLQQKETIIKEVREEIRILETNCDIVDYQAQKLYQILDKGE